MGDTTFSQIGSASDTSILNQGEQSTRANALSGVMNTANSYENLLKSLGGGLGTYNSAITEAAGNFDPNAATNQLMSLMPQLSSLANTAASGSLSEYGQSAQQLADTSTQNALRSTASQMAASGLTNTGAAQASLMEAALAPQQQMATNLAQLQSQYSGNVLGSLMGQAGSGLQSGYSQQGSQNLSAAQTAASNWLQNMGLQSSALAQQGGLYGSAADLTQQQYYTPEYSANPNTMDWMKLLMSSLGSGGQSSGEGSSGLAGIASMIARMTATGGA